VGLLEVASAVSDMLAPETVGQKGFHRLAQEFVPVVPEQLLSQGVDQNNDAGSVNHDDGIRG
jgi:hypothetical protein